LLKVLLVVAKSIASAKQKDRLDLACLPSLSSNVPAKVEGPFVDCLSVGLSPAICAVNGYELQANEKLSHLYRFISAKITRCRF